MKNTPKRIPVFVIIAAVALAALYFSACGGDYPSKDAKTGTRVETGQAQDPPPGEEPPDGEAPEAPGEAQGPGGSAAPVRLVSPTTGSFLNGTVTVSASVAPDAGEPRVAFYLDHDTAPVHTSEAPPYTFSWDTTHASNAVHTVRAETTVGEAVASDTATVLVLNRDESNCPETGASWDLTGKWAIKAETDQRPPSPIADGFIYIIQDAPCVGDAFESWGYNAETQAFIRTAGTIFSDGRYEIDTDDYPRLYIQEIKAWLQVDRIYWRPSKNGDRFEGNADVTIYKAEFGSDIDYLRDLWFPDVVITGSR